MGSIFRKLCVLVLYLNCTFCTYLMILYVANSLSIFFFFCCYSFLAKHTHTHTHHIHMLAHCYTSSPSFIPLFRFLSHFRIAFVRILSFHLSFIFTLIHSVLSSFFLSFSLSIYLFCCGSFIYEATTMCIAGNGNVSMLTEQLRV